MKRILLYLFIPILLITGCGDKKQPITPEEVLPYRTILVYIAANNNLSIEANLNMLQMEQNIGEVDGNLLVYATLPDSRPALYHIYNEKGTRNKEKVKEYSFNQNSSDPYVLQQVIQEAQSQYKAQTYGLVLWSHATGWIPSTVGPIKLKSFGNDDGDEMDIHELYQALPNNLDFIMFDACSMASLEVLYEIKDKAKYIIASPGEVISNGMPYNKIINDLFNKGKESYSKVAKTYFDHYNNMSGLYQSATVTVIETSKLEPIINYTKQALSAQSPLFADYDRNNIQRMDFDPSNPLIAFDFLDFIETNYNSAHVAALKQAVNDAILYKASTPTFNGVTVNKFSGLTCYIPHPDNESVAHDYYRTLNWYTKSGFNLLF